MVRKHRPILLDLFCGAGGAARGYQEAGFFVVGVDIEEQPRYAGDEFIQFDAIEVLKMLGSDAAPYDFDAIHASPPCQAHSVLRHRTGREYPDLIGATRYFMEEVWLPGVIENVPGAPLRDPVRVCGASIDGLRVIRHREFEGVNGFEPVGVECPCSHPLVKTGDKRKAHAGLLDEWTDYVQVTGGGNCTRDAARDAMGIDWMLKRELNEAIPPAYARHIGEQLIRSALKVEA